MDEIIKDFLQESRENLDRLDQEFVKLEGEPGNRELLKSILRTIHTIKGTCGFLGFTKLEALTHAGESLLSLLRDGELQLSVQCADALLEMVDAVRNYLHDIETTEAEGAGDTTELIAKLKKLQVRNSAKAEAVPPPVTPAGPNSGQTETNESPATAESAAKEADASTKQVSPRTEDQNSKKNMQEAPPKRDSSAPEHKPNVKPEDATRAQETQEAGKTRKSGEVSAGKGVANEKQAEGAARASRAEEPKDATIRVDVNLLEKQMNLVSELVLLRNRLLQLAIESNERNLNTTVHGLNYVTSELRKNVMKTRMQPVRTHAPLAHHHT